MQLLKKAVVKDREPVPEHPVINAVYCNRLHIRSHRGLSYATGKGIVSAMDTIHIDLASACGGKMPDAVMHRIEQTLSVEGAAFEYDCYLDHLNIVQKNDVNL